MSTEITDDVLQQLSAGVMKAQADGVSDESLNGVLSQYGLTVSSLGKRVAKRSRKKDGRTWWEKVYSYAGNLAEQAAQGLTFNLSNFLMAGIDMVESGDTWDKSFNKVLKRDREFERENPMVAGTTEIGAGMATGAGIMKGLYKMAPGLAAKTSTSPIKNLAKDLSVQVPLGMVEGGTYTAGAGGDVSTGMQWGAGAGGGSTVLGRIAWPLANSIRKGWGRVRGTRTAQDAYKEKALKKVNKAFEDDSITFDEREAIVKELDALGIEPTLSSTGGRSVQSLGKRSLRQEGPQKTQLLDELEDQKIANKYETQLAMETATGPKAKPVIGPEEYIENAIRNRTKKADVDFQKVRKAPNFHSKVLDKILRVPQFRKIYKAARAAELRHPDFNRETAIPRLPNNKMKSPRKGYSVKGLEQVRTGINDLMDLPPGSDKGVGHETKEMLRANLKVMEKEMFTKVPNYEQAVTTFNTASKELDAYELGLKAYNIKTHAKDVDYQFRNLKTEGEKDHYRLGAVTELYKKFRADPAKGKNVSAQIRSPEMVEKHTVLLPDDEASVKFMRKIEIYDDNFRKANQMTPGSDTAETLLPVVDAIADVVRGGGSILRRTASRAVQMGHRAIRGSDVDQTSKEVGGILTTKELDPNLAVIQEGRKQQRQLSQDLINRGLLTGAITSGAAQRLSDEPNPPLYNRPY